jgi:hypothetical protein
LGNFSPTALKELASSLLEAAIMTVDPLITLRLDGVKSGCERARLAFLVTIISAAAILICLYNDQLSWSLHLLDYSGAARQIAGEPTDSPAELLRAKHVEIVKNAEDNTNITVALLGLKLGSQDLTFFGSIGMLVVSMYYCLCVRRADTDIKAVIADVTRLDSEIKGYVLAGIRQSLVFNILADESIIALSGEKTESPRVIRSVAVIFRAMGYLPTLSILMIIATDAAYFLRERHGLFVHLSWDYHMQFFALDAIALFLLIFVAHLNWLTNRYETSTATTLLNFAKSVEAGGQPVDIEPKDLVTPVS